MTETTYDAAQPKSLGEEWSRYEGKVKQVIRARMPTGGDVEALAQEVAIEFVQRKDTIRGSVPAWLYRVACNKVASFFRNRSCVRRVVKTWAEGSSTCYEPSTNFESEDEQEILQKLVQELPEKLCIVLQLKMEDDKLTFEEIAKLCGCCVKTARKRFDLGIAELRRLLDRERSNHCGAGMIAVGGVGSASGKSLVGSWASWKGLGVGLLLAVGVCVAWYAYFGVTPTDEVAKALPPEVTFSHDVDNSSDRKLAGLVLIGKQGERRYFEDGSVSMRVTHEERIQFLHGGTGWRVTLDLDVRSKYHVLKFAGLGGVGHDEGHRDLTASAEVTFEGRRGEPMREVACSTRGTPDALQIEMLDGGKKAVAEKLSAMLPEVK